MAFLIQVIIVLIVIGVALWLINFLPLTEPIKQIINGLVIVLLVVWLLMSLLGMTSGLQFPRLR